jgi:hypothetical protein
LKASTSKEATPSLSPPPPPPPPPVRIKLPSIIEGEIPSGKLMLYGKKLLDNTIRSMLIAKNYIKRGGNQVVKI